jgi:hypothetical protein
MEAKVKRASEQIQIFDRFRKKFIVLTPEEWVRQHFAHYLLSHKMVPESALMLESEIKYGKVRKRPDISVVNMNNSIWLVVELKASDVAIDENVWQQALTYGSVLKPKYIGLSNGLTHIFSEFRPELNKYVFINDLPEFTVS